MPSFDQVASQITTIAQTAANPKVSLKTYKSASGVFSPNLSSLTPKTKNWFHIYFEINPDAEAVVNKFLSNDGNRINWMPGNIPTLGIMAKNVTLPNVNFDISKKNQYNRWSLNTTKTNYDPVTITFWDDTINMISHFWYAYLSYMNSDSTYVNWKSHQLQGVPIPQEWAQTNDTNSSLYNSSTAVYGLDKAVPIIGSSDIYAPVSRTVNFFESIRIYQLNRSVDENIGPTFNEFVLVHPLIKSFDYDTLDSSDSGFTTNKMSIEYETVLYNTGSVDEIASWGRTISQKFYDDSDSPLGQTKVQKGISNTINLLNQTEGLIKTATTGKLTVGTILADATVGSTILNQGAQSVGLGKMQVPTTSANKFGSGGLPPVVGNLFGV